MSLFQCQHCGCKENTALSAQGFVTLADIYDWTGIEDRRWRTGGIWRGICGIFHVIHREEK
jgi:hypothetical protein